MEPLLTVSEVAKILRVGGTTVRRWAKQGTIEVVLLPQTGRNQAYRLKRETLNRLLNDQRTGSA